MDTPHIQNAIIQNARITTAERGFLDCWLQLDYGGAGQGFGGYALYLPKSFAHHQLLSVAGHFLFRVMEVAGVDTWEQLPGKTIRVKGTHSRIQAIGHIVKDDWFNPAEDFKALKTPSQMNAQKTEGEFARELGETGAASRATAKGQQPTMEGQAGSAENLSQAGRA